MATLQFTDGCSFTRTANGAITIAWNNGHAMRAVRGAAIDYINPAYHMACTVNNGVHTYAPTKDLGRLIQAQVNPKLAMLIVGFRKIATSITGPDAELNLAEIHTVVAADQDGVIQQADWTDLITHQQAYNAILDIAATVLGLNGISLMLKGHNYLESDSMWGRLESAVSLEDNAAALGLTEFAGLLLHDALHPFSPDWKVQLASRVDSPLIGHVNGVLIKRMPGIPAGTTIVFVTRAAIEEINLSRPSAAKVLKRLASGLDRLIRTIRAEPLEWCAMFQRGDTTENLAHIAKVEVICALVYGACTVLFDRKMSIMKSASFKNTAARHPGRVIMGAAWAETLDEDEMSDAAFKKLLGSTESYLEDQFTDGDDSDDDDDANDGATLPTVASADAAE